ncbi:hypothetical protein D3C76_1436190 [compost metagenome]
MCEGWRNENGISNALRTVVDPQLPEHVFRLRACLIRRLVRRARDSGLGRVPLGDRPVYDCAHSGLYGAAVRLVQLLCRHAGGPGAAGQTDDVLRSVDRALDGRRTVRSELCMVAAAAGASGHGRRVSCAGSTSADPPGRSGRFAAAGYIL